MTTEDIMKLAESLADAASECVKSLGSIACTCGTQHSALRSAVDTLVAERDALRTERDTLRQVIEQQLLNVPVGEWKNDDRTREIRCVGKDNAPALEIR